MARFKKEASMKSRGMRMDGTRLDKIRIESTSILKGIEARKVSPRLRPILMKVLSSVGSCDDLVQEVIIQFIEWDKRKSPLYYNLLFLEVSDTWNKELFILIKRFLYNKYKILVRRETENTIYLEEVMQIGSYNKALDSLMDSISEDEKVLVLWKLDLIEESEACDLLSISRATLFNRYKKFKLEFYKTAIKLEAA
jgi:hypothetical protein